MNTDSLYSLDIWNRFSEKFGTTASQFQLKKYPQFDPFFDFFNRKSEIQKLVSDPTLESVARHPFIPFVKILTKTPRYRYQDNEKSYCLDTKIRPIAFASHFDTYLYGFYSFALTEQYQKYIHSQGFQECVLAYRTDLNGKCNIQFAKEVFDSVKEKVENDKSCSVIALDITGYFDNIDHSILKEKWSKVIGKTVLPIDQYKIFRSLTRYSYVNKNSILRHFKVDLKALEKNKVKWNSLLDLIPNEIAGPSFVNKFDLLRNENLIITNLPKKTREGEIQHRGIPQGSAMSAVLSNIYLIDFDDWLFKLSKEMKFTYRRYCDDLIVVCSSEDVNYLNDLIIKETIKYNLTIQDKKTELIDFKLNLSGKIRGFDRKKKAKKINKFTEQQLYKNLQYLGFEFNGQNIYIRPGSMSRYYRKMKGRIVKTVMMAYSNKSKIKTIKKRQIFNKYSHFGLRNFISYVKNSSKNSYSNKGGRMIHSMNSQKIRKQISSHVKIIRGEIYKTSEQRFKQLEAKGIARKKLGKRVKYKSFKE